MSSSSCKTKRISRNGALYVAMDLGLERLSSVEHVIHPREGPYRLDQRYEGAVLEARKAIECNGFCDVRLGSGLNYA